MIKNSIWKNFRGGARPVRPPLNPPLSPVLPPVRLRVYRGIYYKASNFHPEHDPKLRTPVIWNRVFNTFRPEQNCCHSTADIFKRILAEVNLFYLDLDFHLDLFWWVLTVFILTPSCKDTGIVNIFVNMLIIINRNTYRIFRKWFRWNVFYAIQTFLSKCHNSSMVTKYLPRSVIKTHVDSFCKPTRNG